MTSGSSEILGMPGMKLRRRPATTRTMGYGVWSLRASAAKITTNRSRMRKTIWIAWMPPLCIIGERVLELVRLREKGCGPKWGAGGLHRRCSYIEDAALKGRRYGDVHCCVVALPSWGAAVLRPYGVKNDYS